MLGSNPTGVTSGSPSADYVIVGKPQGQYVKLPIIFMEVIHMNVRDITCLKPRNSNLIFKKIEKGSDVFLPMDIALSYAQNLLGRREVPNKSTKNIIQRKLDIAYERHVSPWHVLIHEGSKK
jgi:hypothetical protein